jgi:hypothetical protein
MERGSITIKPGIFSPHLERLDFCAGPDELHDMCLEKITASDATFVQVDGMLPPSVNLVLLERVFMTSQTVRMNSSDPVALGVLWRALAHKYCAIEVLEMIVRLENNPGNAFKANKSLRLVRVWASLGEALLSGIAKSEVIQHLRVVALSWWVLEDIRDAIFKMRSLCSVTSATNDAFSPEIMRAVWPEFHTVRTRKWVAVLRHPNVRPFDHWQRVFAMRECLDDVLPAGVVDDIAAAMCTQEIDWWPDIHNICVWGQSSAL